MTFKTGIFHTAKNSWTNGNETLIEDGMSVTDAMGVSGIGDIRLVKAQDVCKIPMSDGTFREIKSGKPSLWLTGVPWNEETVQDLDRKVDWYNGLSNQEYGTILDKLTDRYQLDSVIHAGNRGQFIIFQFDMGNFSVAKDPNGGHSSLLTIAEDRHTGNKYFGTEITRLFCANQFANLGRDMKAMPSGQDAALILDFQVRVEQSRIEQVKRLNDMFTKPVTKTNITEVANALFTPPVPRRIIKDVKNAVASGHDMSANDDNTVAISEKERKAHRDYRAAIGRQEERIGAFNDLFVRYEAELGANKYALWQTATDVTTHGEFFKSSGDRQQLNRMFGDSGKALQKAWAVVNK